MSFYFNQAKDSTCHTLMKESRDNLNFKYGGKDITKVDNVAFVTCGATPDVELMVTQSNNENSPVVLIDKCLTGYEVMLSQATLDEYAEDGTVPGYEEVMEAREKLRQIIADWLI